MLNKHIGQQPTPVSMLRGEVPAGLEAVVARLLEKDPANRPGTAAEVAELLLPFALQAGPGVIGAPGDPVLALGEQVRREAWKTLAAGARNSPGLPRGSRRQAPTASTSSPSTSG